MTLTAAMVPAILGPQRSRGLRNFRGIVDHSDEHLAERLREQFQIYRTLDAKAGNRTRLAAEDRLMSAVIDVAAPVVWRGAAGASVTEVQDLTQDVAFKIWRWLTGGGQIDDVVRFVRVVAKRVKVDHWRRAASDGAVDYLEEIVAKCTEDGHRSADDLGIGVDAGAYTAPEQAQSDGVSGDEVRQALAQLHAPYRDLLTEVYVDDLDLAELVQSRHRANQATGRHELLDNGICKQCRNSVYAAHSRALQSLRAAVAALRSGRAP